MALVVAASLVWSVSENWMVVSYGSNVLKLPLLWVSMSLGVSSAGVLPRASDLMLTRFALATMSLTKLSLLSYLEVMILRLEETTALCFYPKIFSSILLLVESLTVAAPFLKFSSFFRPFA